MPESFLARHRTICEVLTELRGRIAVEVNPESGMLELCDEAIDYAQRMSARLMEYKRVEESRTYPGGRTKEEWDVIAAANKIATAEYEDD